MCEKGNLESGLHLSSQFHQIPSQHLIVSFLFFVFKYRVSLCSSDCLGTHYVDQVGHKLTEICKLLSFKCWD